MTSLNNQLFYDAEESVKKIIAPLTKLSGITFFSYGINYSEKKSLSLSTHPAYLVEKYKAQFPLYGFYLQPGWHHGDSYIVSKEQELLNLANIGTHISFIIQHQDKSEIFSFGASADNDRFNAFYLNNLNLLKKFTQYFLNESTALIKQAQQQLINVPEKMLMEFPIRNNKEFYQSPDVSKFIDMLHYPFNMLSERELACLKYIIDGYTHTEIGKIFRLSPRTIDCYINRVKAKLKCENKTDIIKIAKKHGIVELDFGVLSKAKEG